MEVDYLTAAPRSFFISVNGGANTELDLNGSSWSLPASTVIPVQLQAGSNTIQFGNDSGYAPALDRIAIAPTVESPTLTGVIASKTGGDDLRVWKIALTNLGNGRAESTRINTFSVTQSGGDGACHPKVIDQLPIELKGIAPGGHADVDVPIDFSGCAKTAAFNVNLIFSANNGADVGDFVGAAEPR
jgi:hypothetical protein